MYHTLNEYMIHGTSVSYTKQMYYALKKIFYTEQMYHTFNKCMTLDKGIITHGTNVSYTERMYHTQNKCIH